AAGASGFILSHLPEPVGGGAHAHALEALRDVRRRIGDGPEAAREEVAVEQHLALIAVGLVERLLEHLLKAADPVRVHARVTARGVVEGPHGPAVLELAGETAAVRARTGGEARRRPLAVPHLDARRRRARGARLGAVSLEGRRGDYRAPVHEAVLAVEHGAGERFGPKACELRSQHQREEGRVAARGARWDVEGVVAELALDVL